MKNSLIIWLAVTLISATGLYAATPLVKNDVDWPAFLARQDMLWHRLPERWDDAPFLGNGWLGTMIYCNGTNKHELRLDAQHAGVNDHRPARLGGGAFAQARLPIGCFIVTTCGELQDCDWRLDLWNAELIGTLRTTKGTVSLRAFIHAKDMVTQVELRGDEGEAPTVEFRPDKAISPRAAANWKRPVPSPAEFPPNPDPDPLTLDGVNVSRQSLVAGGEYATAWTFKTNGNLRTLRFSIAQSYPQSNAVAEAVATLHRTSAIPMQTWEAVHRQWWHAFYPRSFVSVPDPFWESFYWIQRYKLGSATRADRCLIDNHGPWLEATPWPYATWNHNVQLTYWPFNAAGLLDEARSLPNHLRACATALQTAVPEAYRADSAAVSRAATESLEGEVGIPGSKSAEVGNLTWALHDVWLQYRHTMDESLLRDPLFPLLRRSINYYRHFLTAGADGRLHLPATFSPEYGSAPDCNYDLALIRWGCQTLIWANDRLKLDDPLVPDWREILEKLTPYPGNDSQGFFIGAGVPYAESHRHYSHLLMIYPLYLVNRDQPGGRDQIERCIADWQSKPKGLLGFSFTGAASLYATIGDGDRALEKLDGLRRFLTATTMYHESGPCIETPLSAAQAMHDMMLQSWGDTIRIFPAWPSAWKDGSFHDLRTEGAFLVSAVRKDGRTRWVRVKSLAGEPFRIRPGLTGKLQVSGSGAAHVKELSSGNYALNLAKDEDVIFLTEPGPRDLRPVSSKADYRFGLP